MEASKRQKESQQRASQVNANQRAQQRPLLNISLCGEVGSKQQTWERTGPGPHGRRPRQEERAEGAGRAHGCGGGPRPCGDERNIDAGECFKPETASPRSWGQALWVTPATSTGRPFLFLGSVSLNASSGGSDRTAPRRCAPGDGMGCDGRGE